MAQHTVTLSDDHEAAVAGLVANLNATKENPDAPDVTVEEFIAARFANGADQWLAEWKAVREKAALASFYNKTPEEQAVILQQLGVS